MTQIPIDLTALTHDITVLESGPVNRDPGKQQNKIVTVRMTESQHAALKKAAHRAEQSMNTFCLVAALNEAIKTLEKSETVELTGSE